MSKSGDYVSQATALGPLLLLDFADRHWAYDHSNHNPQSLNHRLLIMNKEPYNGNFFMIEMRTKVSSFIFKSSFKFTFRGIPNKVEPVQIQQQVVWQRGIHRDIVQAYRDDARVARERQRAGELGCACTEPRMRTQSSEAQERAARLSKPVDTGELQKVAAGDMRGESKGLCAGKETRMFHDVISARKVPRQRILLIKHLLTDAYLTGKKNLYLMFLVHVTVLSDATKGIVTVTSGSLGNATNPSVTVMVASVHSLTVLGRYPLQK
ncbi:hypothetical protein B0H13DRAFT_1887226 [Mycena leptocephala]|nr:hypothetical protein B0H13DRAFT_1887226 [Mycena leptocephala]